MKDHNNVLPRMPMYSNCNCVVEPVADGVPLCQFEKHRHNLPRCADDPSIFICPNLQVDIGLRNYVTEGQSK